MTGSQKDDADHLARYAEHLMEHASAILLLADQRRAEWIAQKREASRLLMRARIAIREAHAQIK